MQRAINPKNYRTHTDHSLTTTSLARTQPVPFYFLYSQKNVIIK